MNDKFANLLNILKQSCQIVSEILSLWKLDIVFELVVEQLERKTGIILDFLEVQGFNILLFFLFFKFILE